ncbi:MAG: DTW domain-containing protein [Spirochaetes bacterium]|nr:DTW domain-containing protein [Spirochaetota bacterium]
MQPVPDTGRCYRCLRPRSRCYCNRIRPLETRTHFALCMHTREYRHQKTGTGRLARLALTHSQIFTGMDFTHDGALNALLNDPAYAPHLLFPGPAAIQISRGEKPALAPGRKLLVVLVDATWPWARKILRASSNLRALPCLSLDPTAPSRFAIKRQPHPACVSTIEAAYEVLLALAASGMEDPGLDFNPLVGLLEDLVAYQIERKKAEAESAAAPLSGRGTP